MKKGDCKLRLLFPRTYLASITDGHYLFLSILTSVWKG